MYDGMAFLYTFFMQSSFNNQQFVSDDTEGHILLFELVLLMIYIKCIK